MNQNVYLGEESSQYLNSILNNINSKNILLIRGDKSYQLCGAKNIIEKKIFNNKYSIFEFYDFEINPKIEDLNKGLKYLEGKNIDTILSIGGGSVIDMAKLMRFFYSYQGNIYDNIYQKKRDLLPLIVMPTTSGTGAEATNFSVLYKNNMKYSIAHSSILPDFAIIDPIFTYNNTRYLTACTGFDALSQAIESYWNIYSTKESDQYAIKAIKLLFKNLPIIQKENTKEIRNEISEGAFWAGKAINITKTTAPHAFSYPFTTYYKIPHGHAVALTFPFFADYNFNANKNQLNKIINFNIYNYKINNLCTILNTNRKENINIFFYEYIKSIGLTYKLPLDLDYKKITENINIQRLTNNPRILTNKDILEIIKDLKIKSERSI